MRAFIQGRGTYGLTRYEMAEAQLQRARMLARGEDVDPVIHEYESLMLPLTRDAFLADPADHEARVKAAAAILERSPGTRISPVQLMPHSYRGPREFKVEEKIADGLFSVAEAREVIAKKPNKSELVELFFAVSGKTSYAAKDALLDAIEGATRPSRPPRPPAAPSSTTTVFSDHLAPTIARLQAQVDRLESRVASLEAANEAKLREINSLVAQIEQRKAVLRDNYEDNRTAGMLFAMFGAPSAAMVSLMAMERDDTRLGELNRQLVAHRAEQARLEATVAEYEAVARPARQVLATLESAARSLSSAALVVSDPRLAPAAAAAARIGAGTKLVVNLREQLEILEGLRGRASSINESLRALVEVLEEDLRSAEKMVEDSRAEAHQVLQLLIDPDPETAARALLEARGRAIVEKAQRELGLKVETFVADLVSKAFPRGGATAEALKQRILAEF